MCITCEYKRSIFAYNPGRTGAKHRRNVNGKQANSYTEACLREEILCQALAQRKQPFGQGKCSEALLNAFTTKNKAQLWKINICNKRLKGRNVEGKYTL